MAESPIGSPSGPSGGPRSATAATFQTDDKSLRSLSKVFKELTKDVGDFNRGLIALEKGSQTVDRLAQKLSALGLTPGGGAAGTGGTTTRSSTTRVATPGVPGGASTTTRTTTSAQLGQTGGFVGGNAGAGGGGGGGGWKKPTAAAYGIATGIGGLMRSQLGSMSDMDLMYTQSTLSSGRGFSGQQYRQNINTLQSMGGFQSAQDLMGGVGAMQGALGAGLGNARTNAALASAGQLSALNPSLGFQGSSQAAAGLYNPVVQNRMRSLGVQQGGSQGKLKTPQQIYQQIQKLVFRGQRVTADMIGEGMQPGAPLYRTLIGLGLDEATMEQFRMYALVQANLGSSALADKALSDASKGKRTDLTRKAGLDSIRSAQNALGGAKVKMQSELMEEGRGTLIGGFDKLADVTDGLTKSFDALQRHMPGSPGGIGAAASFLPGAGALSSVAGAGATLFNLQMIQGLMGGGSQGGGLRGRLAGGLKGGATGAAGMSGMFGTPVFVTNWPGGGGFGGGGGGGGGLGGGLGPNDTGMPHGPANMGRLGRFGRGMGIGGRALMGGRGLLGAAGAGEAGAAGWGAAGTAGAAAVPLLAAAAIGTAAGMTARHGMQHDGMIRTGMKYGLIGGPLGMLAVHATKSNEQLEREDSSTQDEALNKAQRKFSSGGYMQIPDCATEYRAKVRPLIIKAAQGNNKDAKNKALHELNQLMARYASQLADRNHSRGLTDSGKVMLGTEAQMPMSYSIGQPGGANEGGNGNVAGTTKPSAASSLAGAVIGTAKSFLGKPYKWGGANPKTSFDCSGLMQWSFGQNGIKLPRTAAQQQRVGSDIPTDQLVPGDLVFYGSPAHHVAMYVGGGKMIEAPRTGKNIGITSLRKPTNARRVLSGAGQGDFSAGGSPDSAESKGDSGTGPHVVGSANMARGGAGGFGGGEAEALSAYLNTPATFGASVNGRSSISSSKGDKKTTSQSAGTPTGPAPGGTVGGWVKQALGLLHLDFDKYAPGIASIIQHESGGNPRAINKWDSNWKAGHPSKGVMQTIDSTFNRWKLPGHDDIWNPVDNIAAATRYAISRYGSIDNVPGIKSMRGGGKYKGYSQGSYDTAEGMAYLHGDEMIVPAGPARKVRSMLARQGQRAQSAPARSALSAGSSAGVVITMTCPVTVVGKGTAADATDFLRMVKDQAATEFALDSMGSG